MISFKTVLAMTFAISVSLITQVSAQSANFSSLKGEMKQSGNILKQIGGSINDASKNQENAALTAKIIAYFESSRTQSPGNGSFAEYQSLMDQEIQLLKELQSAFQNNDNAAALGLMQKINTTKKEGHDKFK